VSDPRETLQQGEPAEHPPASEPRVGDLLSGQVSPAARAELDPETMAQLAAWFGVPTPAGATARSEGPLSKRGEAALRRQRALDAVDRAFLTALEGKWTQGHTLLRITRPLGQPRRSPTCFDLDAWNLQASDELREAERPEDISDALKDPTPQAVLRDLHRPDQQWPLRLLPEDMGLDVAGTRTRSRIDTALRTRYVVRMDDEPIPARLMLEDMAALRAHLDEPWESFYVPPEKRRAPASLVPSAEDFKWFGMTGFDPDL
jgi:hypothetical protein